MKRSYFLKQLIALPFGPYLAHKFLKNDKKTYLLNKFYVAGFQYYEGPSLIEEILSGEELTLKADQENKYDKFAVAIYYNSVMIGHVPRTDNKHISRLLRQGAGLRCIISEANPGKETWKMLKVELSL